MLRSRPWRVATVGVTLAVFHPLSLAAQRVHNAFVETRDTRLELIGLKRWTLAMIQDSLARYAPGDSLTSHACAAILRQKLGFADAAVQFYPAGFFGNTKGYFSVPVVEPQDSARVRYRAEPRDSAADRAEWLPALAVFRDHNQVFQTAIQRPSLLLGQTHPDSARPPLAGARPLFEFLRAHRRERDRHEALRTLAQDGNWQNRVIAAVIIAGFADSDSTWWALVDALRDRDGRVSATATQVLTTLSRSAARTVNWAPAVDPLRAVLDGTNLFAHNALLETLAATRVDPSLARLLLRGGGELVIAKLRSEDPIGVKAAQNFLLQVSGGGLDFGRDAGAWEAWIRSM